MMLSVLALGFLIGMRHALEADHVAAVATLTSQTKSVRDAVPLGLLWGAGHTVTLFIFCSAALLLGTLIPDDLARFLELAVGVMLIVLGGDVLVRLVRERIHFHAHRHDGGIVHFHAHSHAGEKRHDPGHHIHVHGKGIKVRAFMIGIMHGMAGSAALIVLTASSISSTAVGFAYITLFGLGSVLGMGLLTTAIVWPLNRLGRTLTWMHNGAKGCIGVFTVVLGAVIVLDSGLLF